MIIKKIYAVGCGLIMLTAGCSDNNGPQFNKTPYMEIPLTAQTRSVVDDANGFSLNLFRNIAENVGDDNLCVSPYSMFAALSMTANADNGETSQQLLEILTDDRTPISTLNEYNRMLMEYLPKVDGQTICAINNSVWYDPAYSLTESFSTAMREYYAASLMSVSPKGENGRKAINEWVKDKTFSMIPEFLTAPLNIDVALINAAYFKSLWEKPFDKSRTAKKPFYNIDDSRSTVDMMHLKEELLYSSTDMLQMVSLPYGNGNYVMEVVTTTDKCKATEMLAAVTKDEIQTLRDKRKFYDVSLSMPKFSAGSRFSASDCLAKMGLKSDILAGLINEMPINISDIIQETVLKVDESGTEAAAVTMVGDAMSPPPSEFVTLTVNKPFIYIIREASTGTILFMGQQTKF